MKILVTGAKGFVGKNLCAALKNIKDGKDRRFPDLAIEDIFPVFRNGVTQIGVRVLGRAHRVAS